jgi:hypothetical protein
VNYTLVLHTLHMIYEPLHVSGDRTYRDVLNGPRQIVLILTCMVEASLSCPLAKTASQKSVPIRFYRISTRSTEIHQGRKTRFCNACISAKTQRIELKLAVCVHGTRPSRLRLIPSSTDGFLMPTRDRIEVELRTNTLTLIRNIVRSMHSSRSLVRTTSNRRYRDATRKHR